MTIKPKAVQSAASLNEAYLDSMKSAKKDTVLGRIRDLWWPSFLKHYAKDGRAVLDHLDVIMNESRDDLAKLAEQYAIGQGAKPGSAKFTQLVSQFLKSNTGKMFERFVGLALAHVLLKEKAPYCVQPFKTETIKHCPGLKREDFRVTKKLGGEVLATIIDADLLIFNPTDADAPIYMTSIKTTLKDRFHNVPFWNLLRRMAITDAIADIEADNASTLARMKYVAICTDLADEQPDFAGSGGPRMMLRFDAGLLDGAYVTASNAIGLGTTGNHMGPERDSAFNPLTRFADLLSGASG